MLLTTCKCLSTMPGTESMLSKFWWCWFLVSLEIQLWRGGKECEKQGKCVLFNPANACYAHIHQTCSVGWWGWMIHKELWGTQGAHECPEGQGRSPRKVTALGVGGWAGPTGVVRNRNKLPFKYKISTLGSVLGIAYPERPPVSLLGDPHRHFTLSWSFSSFYRTVSPLRDFLHCLT